MARLKFGASSLLGRIIFGPATVTEIIDIIASPATGEMHVEGMLPKAAGEFIPPQVTGVLYDPLGNPLIGSILRFTALDSIGYSIEGSIAEYTSAEDGTYDFILSLGKYRIEAKYDDEYHDLGLVIVDKNIPPIVTVADLILYGSPVTPPIIVEAAPDWIALFEEAQNQGEHREAQYQIRQGDDYTSETKELWVAADATMTDESLESKARSTKMISQVRVYEDDALNQASLVTQEGTTGNIRTYTSMEAYEASNGAEEIKSTEVLEGTKAKIEDSKHVTNTSLEVVKEVAFESTSIQETVVADASSLEQSLITTVGGSSTENSSSYTPTHIKNNVIVPHPQATQDTTLSISEVISNVTHSAQIVNTQEVAISIDELAMALRTAGIKVYDKEAFQQLSIEEGKSKLVTQVDDFNIQDDAGFALAEFDTIGNTVTINGKLVIDNPEDFQGEVGGTYDFIYEYSQDNGVTDPWHEIYSAEHPDRWRRQRKTLDTVAIGTWSEGIYLNAKDGADGDVYFNQYQYSSTDITKAADSWHNDYVTSDDWRRWRVIENGFPVSVGHEFYGPEAGWYEERMKGADGPAGWVADVKYQYSVDNLPPWHNDFITGDLYRREKVDWYASNTDFLMKDDSLNPSTPILAGVWTSGAKIAPELGVDYGDKYATILMYKRSNTPLVADTPSTITYDFETTLLDPTESNGWTAAIPEGLEDIWVAVGTAHGLGATDTIDDWVVEKQVVNGFKSAIGWLYQATDMNTSLQAVDLPVETLKYDFLSGRVIALAPEDLKDWTTSIPDMSGGGRLWTTFNTALAPVAENEDELTAGDWETPAILSQSGIDGDSGSFTSYVYRNAVTIPDAPQGGALNAGNEDFPHDPADVNDKWDDDPVNAPTGETTWVSTTIYTLIDTNWIHSGWSTPARFSGEKGEEALTVGKYTSFVYRNSGTTPNSPIDGSFDGETEIGPEPYLYWSDAATSPSSAQFTWMSRAIYTYNNTTKDWAHAGWSTPSKLSGDKGDQGNVGDDGDAGSFTTFVYRNWPTAPSTPINGSFVNNVLTPPHYTGYPSDIWDASPEDPLSNQYVWISSATYEYSEGSWSHSGWSSPTRHSGEQGTDAGRFTSFVYRNAGNQPQTPENGSYTGTTETPPHYPNDPNSPWDLGSSTPDVGDWVWVSTSVYLYDDDTGLWSNNGWTVPTKISGSDGINGSGWFSRDNVNVVAFTNETTFNWATYGDDIADSFPTHFGGRLPVDGDILAVSNSTGTHSDTGMYDAAQDRFEAIASQINGNMLVTGTLNADRIRSNSITATQLATSELITTSAQIGSAVVTNAKIDALAVTSAKIANLAVTNAKLGTLAVREANIDSLAVTEGKIANLAVGTAKIKNAAIETLKIGTDAVTVMKVEEVLSSVGTSSSAAFTVVSFTYNHGHTTTIPCLLSVHIPWDSRSVDMTSKGGVLVEYKLDGVTQTVDEGYSSSDGFHHGSGLVGVVNTPWVLDIPTGTHTIAITLRASTQLGHGPTTNGGSYGFDTPNSLVSVLGVKR